MFDIDLKPKNFLIAASNENFSIKITGFGSARDTSFNLNKPK
jgi:hypothetical protein